LTLLTRGKKSLVCSGYSMGCLSSISLRSKNFSANPGCLSQDFQIFGMYVLQSGSKVHFCLCDFGQLQGAFYSSEKSIFKIKSAKERKKHGSFWWHTVSSITSRFPAHKMHKKINKSHFAHNHSRIEWFQQEKALSCMLFSSDSVN
jgi:hypothetical protein